jgi:ABC-2 type transport system permease protein
MPARSRPGASGAEVLRTAPAALWSLLTAVTLVVAFGVLYSLLREARPPHGALVATFDPDPVTSLSPWTGFGVFCAYAAVLLALAALRMRRGDA